MLFRSSTTSRAEFEAGTGWQLKPEGACKGDVCIPLGEAAADEALDVRRIAAAIGLPVAEDAEHGLLATGPEAVGGRALTTARAPDLRLPDLAGNEFSLASLLGRKVLIYAWAPY